MMALSSRGERQTLHAVAILVLSYVSLLALDGSYSRQRQTPSLFAHSFVLLPLSTTSTFGKKAQLVLQVQLQQDLMEYSPVSPLPPRTTSKRGTRIRNKPRNNHHHDQQQQPWDGENIPDQIPKLSDVLLQTSTSATTTTTTTTTAIPSRRRKPSSSTRTRPKTRQPPEHNTSLSSSSSQQQHERIPWKAGYYTSLKSQKRIQRAAESTRRQPPLERAFWVLTTFLSIPPEQCNAANLVCALTTSAKVMGSSSSGMSNSAASSTRRHAQHPTTNQDSSSSKVRSLLYQTLDILSQMLQRDRNALSARQLCNAVWAIAKHADRDEELLPRAPTEVAVDWSSESAPRGRRQAETWDLSKDLAGCPSQRVDATIDEIALQLTAILQQDSRAAKEGELCMASWAFGILRKRRRPPGWKQGPQLGSLPRTAAAASPVKNPLFKDFGLDTIRFEQWNTDNDNIEVCSASCVTDILFDKIGETLLEPIDSHPFLHDRKDIARRIEKCRWSEVANLAWAFATHGSTCSRFSQELMLGVAHETTRRLREGHEERAVSRDIAQIVWSLGTLQADNYRLADGLVELVDAVGSEWIDVSRPRPLQDWSCPDLVQVALSLAHARLDDHALLRDIFGEATRRLTADFLSQGSCSNQYRQSFLAWEISILLWSQARLYLTAEQGDVFSTFANKAVTVLHSAVVGDGHATESLGMGPQEQANIAWSLTVLELYGHQEARELLTTIFTGTAASCKQKGVIQLEHAHQLWQALFVLEGECPECVANVPEWFYDDLREKWFLEKSRTKISSARHKSLSKLLDLMGVTHYNEHDEDIDVAIVLKPMASWSHQTESTRGDMGGVKVAVEFDGPNHFTRKAIRDRDSTKSPRALGHTVFKYRLLRRQGWTVIRVPFYEFDRIPFWSSMERQRYLQRLLKTHCNLRFSEADVSVYKVPIRNKTSRFE